MTSPVKPNPVIFIHGLWIHSSAWQPWLDLFENYGYAVSAPGWPGNSQPSPKHAKRPMG
ncbi:MAG: alpha/beta hydrolase [Mycobacterium sp.]|jgi:pimeloyl-ACP methyl ester carboxylesterase|nr:alpha/beta hydrolase [Mycobacterium sp.]